MNEATVMVAGRRVTLAGAHPAYLADLDGRDLDQSPLASVDIPRDVACLDVGANIGATAIPLAVRRPDLRITAFEPVPSNVAFLRRNIQQNGVTNIEVVEAAVGDVAGAIRIVDNGPWSVVTEGAGVSVPIVRLDDAVKAAPAFIKIDAEGYEPNVLAGASRLLSESPLVLMEFNSWALIRQHRDPLSFADVLYTSADISDTFANDLSDGIPADSIAFVHTNILRHGCVTDILFRLKRPFPSLEEMTRFSDAGQARVELDAVLQSTSWRITAPMRWLSRRVRRRG